MGKTGGFLLEEMETVLNTEQVQQKKTEREAESKKRDLATFFPPVCSC